MNEILSQEIADGLTDFLCDYSSVKPYLFIQVINQDNHAGELERLIYRSHYELAITCHIDVSHIVGLPATVTVTHEMLDILGIDEEDKCPSAQAGEGICHAGSHEGTGREGNRR